MTSENYGCSVTTVKPKAIRIFDSNKREFSLDDGKMAK